MANRPAEELGVPPLWSARGHDRGIRLDLDTLISNPARLGRAVLLQTSANTQRPLKAKDLTGWDT